MESPVDRARIREDRDLLERLIAPLTADVAAGVAREQGIRPAHWEDWEAGNEADQAAIVATETIVGRTLVAVWRLTFLDVQLSHEDDADVVTISSAAQVYPGGAFQIAAHGASYGGPADALARALEAAISQLQAALALPFVPEAL